MEKNNIQLEEIMKPHYDPEEDLHRVEHDLHWSFQAKPMFNFKTNSEENDKRVNSWHEKRLSEIATEEKSYRERLERARKSGTIDEHEYMRAVMKLGVIGDPFTRARQEASEIFRKEVKYL